MSGPKRSSLEDKLSSGVLRGATDECWPWTKSLTVHGGYGQFTHGKGNLKKAHRVAYELAYGPVPDGLFVCHRCNNPKCCNPNHLYAGTPADNWKDTRDSGKAHRFATRMGSECGRSVLTDADVVYIRATNEQGASLARRFGVSKSAITSIRKGRTWKHVPRTINKLKEERNA